MTTLFAVVVLLSLTALMVSFTLDVVRAIRRRGLQSHDVLYLFAMAAWAVAGALCIKLLGM